MDMNGRQRAGYSSPVQGRPPVLQVQALSVQRRPGWAELPRSVLHELSFSVAAGELVMLMGANGAGKSTLLSALAGDWPLAAGQVSLHGRPLKDWRARELALLRALLPQRAALSQPFLAHEVVRLGCWARRERPAQIEQIVAATLAACGVAALAARPLPELSGGEQARVHLARVLAQLWPAPDAGAPAWRQPCLLLDEPCASLDPAHQHAVCEQVRGFARRSGAAVLMSMHDVNLAAQYADRLLILSQGRLLQEGAPAQLLAQPQLAACFGVGIANWALGPQRQAAVTYPL
jgi:iron complex transport system ATP-binding protein